MATKFIYHFKTLDVVDDVLLNNTPASEKPIVIIGSVDGKHTQVNIQPFNAAHQLEASLSFATRMQYYAKTLRPWAQFTSGAYFVTQVAADDPMFN